MKEEVFAIIDEAPRYEVSNLGRVRNRTTGRVLSQARNARGYLVVNLVRPDGRQRTAYVHRLVAKHHVTPIPKPQVNHIDGVKTNNAASNLEWVTCAENLAHARRIGLIPVGGRTRGKDRQKRRSRSVRVRA